jgi:L-iditol 2-dehydrogenase
VPETNVKYGTLRLPDNVSYEEATMIEPLACTVAGQKRLGLKEGQAMLVLGCGVSGLTHIQLAKLKNIKVIATDLNEYRLEKARQLGADYAVNAGDFSIDRLRELNDGNLAEAVVVCTGASGALSDAIDCVDRRGTILFFAITQEDICLPPVRFWRDELSVVFSYGAAGEDLEESLELIASGRLPVKDLISRSLPLKDIAEGFRLVSQAGESLKVVVTPG